MPVIRGGTDLYLIAGDPVDNVRLPRLFNACFERFGLDAVMAPVAVRTRDFAVWMKAAFLGRNCKGMLIAPPLKPLVADLMNGCSLFARVAGSANIVRRTADGSLEADLFDGEGLVGALDRFEIAFRDRRVLVLGAGVSGTAIAVTLADAGSDEGAGQVALHDPVPGKAASAAARIGAAFRTTGVVAVESSDPAGFDLVINATALGVDADDPLPCDVERMPAGAALFDIVLRGQPTALVRAARARGLRAEPGFEMLVQQMPHYFDYFGLADAAARVREDAGFLRALIDPDTRSIDPRQPAAEPKE